MPLLESRRNPGSLEYTSRMIEASWRRIIAIAHNHNQDVQREEDLAAGQARSMAAEFQGSEAFYERERRMVNALDTLFNLAYEGRGFLIVIPSISKGFLISISHF